MRTIAMWFFMLAVAMAPVEAAQPGLEAWFNQSTGLYGGRSSTIAMSRPDYLPGTTRDDVCRAAKVRGTPVNGLYELQAYDVAHRLALANFFTDGCNVVLFSATRPSSAKGVKNADLSGYRTARGLSVGSSYAQVRRTYGGPPNASSRFVVTYTATAGKARAYASPGGMVDVPEKVVVLVENQRVKSIAILIDFTVLT